MPSFTVTRESKYSADETFSRVRAALSSDGDLKDIDSAMTYDFDEAARICRATSKKFTAEIVISDKGETSSVAIAVKLPMIFAPLKGMVEKILVAKLDEQIG